ncbi:MAG: AraC family transcriptional regulator [Cyclobacteriaceae bacterium]|nr:AraC family transcriptional regulator [Cyclobacteriaceae bacterium]
MEYKTFKPQKDLETIVKYYWTLKVPFDTANQKQKIIPDGCIEMTFNFGDKIKRFISEYEYIINPDAMVMGQRTKPYDILPIGNVDTFAICFYPHGFANFINTPLETIVNKEIPVAELFGKTEATALEQQIRNATTTAKRIEIIEIFLLEILNQHSTISNIVKSTVDAILKTNGTKNISNILDDKLSKRRQLERHFKKQIGISPKQLCKVIRLQATLQMLLNQKNETLTELAYENEYFDQNHFIKDFKELIGVTPKEFMKNEEMTLSTLFYK